MVLMKMFKVDGPVDAPDCIIPHLFGVNAVKTCAMETHHDPRPWIAKYVEVSQTLLLMSLWRLTAQYPNRKLTFVDVWEG